MCSLLGKISALTAPNLIFKPQGPAPIFEPRKKITNLLDCFIKDKQNEFFEWRQIFWKSGIWSFNILPLRNDWELQTYINDCFAFAATYLNYPKTFGPEKILVTTKKLNPVEKANFLLSGVILGQAGLSRMPFQTKLEIEESLYESTLGLRPDIMLERMSAYNNLMYQIYGTTSFIWDLNFVTSHWWMENTLLHEACHILHMLYLNRLGELELMQRFHYFADSKIQNLYQRAGFREVSSMNQHTSHNVAELLPEILLDDFDWKSQNLLTPISEENYYKHRRLSIDEICWNDFDKVRPFLLMEGIGHDGNDPDAFYHKFPLYSSRVWLKKIMLFSIRRYDMLGFLKNSNEKFDYVKNFLSLFLFNQFSNPKKSIARKQKEFEAHMLGWFSNSFYQLDQLRESNGQREEVFDLISQKVRRSIVIDNRQQIKEMVFIIKKMGSYLPEIMKKYGKFIDLSKMKLDITGLKNVAEIGYAFDLDPTSDLFMNNVWQELHDMDSPNHLQKNILRSINQNIDRLKESEIVLKEETIEHLQNQKNEIANHVVLSQKEAPLSIDIQTQKKLKIDILVEPISDIQKNGPDGDKWVRLEKRLKDPVFSTKPNTSH